MVDEYIKNWIRKAMNDLQVCINERGMDDCRLVTDAICFHAQQAVEKFLKAYLASHNIEFGKTHNLKILLNKCADIDGSFKHITTGELTDYAVEVRYPDDFYMPSKEEADECVQIAETVREFVMNKLGLQKKDL